MPIDGRARQRDGDAGQHAALIVGDLADQLAERLAGLGGGRERLRQCSARPSAASARRNARVTGDLLQNKRDCVAKRYMELSQIFRKKLRILTAFAVRDSANWIAGCALPCRPVWTSEMRRLSRLAVLLAAAAALAAAPQNPARRVAHPAPVPKPEQVFGFRSGRRTQAGRLRARSPPTSRRSRPRSPRVRLYTIGKSTEGRDMMLAAISSEDNLQRLARFKDIARQLADSRRPHRRRRRTRSPAKARRSSGSISVCMPPKSRQRRSRPEVAYTVATSETGRNEADSRQCDLRHGAGHEPRRPRHRRATGIARNVGTPYEGTTAAVAVPEVRGARQQPRLVHAEPRGDARHHRAALSRVVSAGALQPASVGP